MARPSRPRSPACRSSWSAAPSPRPSCASSGFTAFVTVPEPNTWREVAAQVEQRLPLAGKRVVVQEHGAPSRELYDRLRSQGADVTAVPVYRWALPEDTAPLRRALHEIAAGGVSIALFTSRAQVEHAFAIAAEEKLDAAVKDRLRRGVIASIGPVCSEAIRAEGLEPDFEPEHPKMGHLVKTAAERAAVILQQKQR
ncbi:MAG: uroporphyrinogen-III synthase [Minicystis sp.]